MARKTTTDPTEYAVEGTEATGEAVETSGTESGTAEEKQGQREKPEQNTSGFYCYIGPNLKKLIQTGTIYRGTREEALARAAEAIEAQPLVKTLIVSGDKLPEARLKVKRPGNVLYASYQQLAGKEGK